MYTHTHTQAHVCVCVCVCVPGSHDHPRAVSRAPCTHRPSAATRSAPPYTTWTLP